MRYYTVVYRNREDILIRHGNNVPTLLIVAILLIFNIIIVLILLVLYLLLFIFIYCYSIILIN